MLLELKAANQRLRELGIRVTIKYTGQWLYPRAVLPPKPGGSKIKPYCQEVTLPGHGLPATVTGWKKAEKVAARLWSSVVDNTLDPYREDSIGQAIQRKLKIYPVIR